MKSIEKIYHLRKMMGWSQEVMGDNLGLSKRQYGRLENEECRMTLKRFDEICTVFGVTPRQFEDLSLEDLKEIIEIHSKKS